MIEQGPRGADNILVLVPGRRENLLEDHSALDRALARQITPRDLFRYYLEWIGDPSIVPRLEPIADASVPYARRWGMAVAIRDLRNVIRAARRGGHRVVLGGHSLGGTITVAYATWDFAGGVFNVVGSTAARIEPDAPAVLGGWRFLPANLRPPVPTTNAGGYGYAFDDDTSPESLRLIHMHIGSLAAGGDPRGWVDGELGTVARAATMFSGIRGIDGTAWYHPVRLSIDGGAVNGGVRNGAQRLLGVRATHGDDLDLPIYAIETSLGTGRVLKGARALARRSHASSRC